MTNFNWYSAVDGDWNNLADWDQFEVPQAADDVTIDLPAATSPYTVTIASSESKAVNSVILDDVSNDQGTLAIDGTLAVTGTVSSDGGLFNLQGGTIAATELDISAGTNGGFVQGYGTIASDVVNNATLSAVGGTLVVTGALTGTGQVIFDFDATQASYTNSSETLQVGTVSAGQTITTNGNDTLVLTTPGAFAGTIWAQAGDQIVLLGDTVGNATDTNGTLVVTDTSNNVLADLALTGDYNGDIFTVNGSTITIVSSVVPPTISGTMSNQSMTSAQTITPFTGVTIGDQNVNQTETVTVTLSAAGNGTLSNLGGGSYDPVGGVYTDVGSAATVTSDLDGLVFTPTVTGTLGATATTTFTISDIDTAVQVASDSNTTVNVTVVAQAYSWTSAISDDWSNAADWTPNGVPGATADVTIDQAAGLGNYTVTIGSGESEVVNSIALNDVSNSDGTLAINGTLTFAAGSPGTITGPAQNYITMDGGTLVNAAEVDGLLQTQGDVLITGTNAVNVANWLQDLSGTVTIDTSSIYNVYGSLLSGGTFEATPGATIDLGGTLEGAMVAIGTITQGLGVPTEVILDDNGTIDQWNGSAYVPLQDTLTEIDTGGTLDVLQGGGFVSGNTLSIDGGLLNLQAGTIAPAELDINSGVVQGYAEIASNVVNNSTLTALGGTLIVDGALSGTGVVQFDIDTQAGTTASTGSTLEVGSVGSGQTITMNGTDTLVLTTPDVCDGTIAAQVGDQIVLQGDDLGVASYIGGDLYVYDTGFNELANLTLAGDYSNDTFMVSGSTITVAATTPPAAPPSQPTISGMTSDQTTTSGQVITPFNGVSIADTNVDQTETLTVTLSDQSDGILSGFSTGTYDVSSGTYSDTGSLSQINGDLAALVFTPAVIGTIGAMTTTTFTISDTDTAAQTVTDSTTSVIATTAEQAYSWSTAASDDWSNAFDWTPQAVPGAAADVTIDETVATNAYVVTIGTNEAEIVNTLTLNDVNNLLGTLAINGTLTFTPGASGDIVGPATSVITMNNGTLVNVGTVDGLISATGNVLLTGTNGFYDSSLIQESAGTLTIDTLPIDTISVNILQSGLFESYLSDAVIDLGGPLAGDDANIATIAGPNGPTEITLVGNGAFNTWNGSSYSALQDTLTEIDAGGTLDVLQGGSYVSSNTLLVNGGLLNLGAATISVAELDIAGGGIVLGNATIASDVVNNSTLSAIGGTLIIGGTLSGSGLVQFDLNGSFSDPTGAVLQVGAVSEGQTFYMNGRDTLVLSAPDLFAGTIAALAGDQIVLLGDTIGGATDTNGTLFVTDTSDNLLASLALSGDAGETFTANGSTIDVGTFYFQPTITGTNGDQAITSVQTITPFSGVTVSDQNANQLEDLTVTLTVPANGTLSNLGAGFYDPTMGIYTDNNESAAQISADLNGLVFTPTATGTLGATFTTGFNIVVIDSADQTAADSTTTVTETIVPPVFDWTTGTTGYWGTAANWAQNNAPNGTDDVTIDAPATNGVYTAYIAGDESEVVNSLTLNAVNNYSGVSAPVYTAAELEIDGTLTFASGSAGTIAGPVQSLIDMNGGTLVNAGSVSAIIQTQNTVLIAGTNDLTIAGGLIDTFGTVTIDTASLGIIYGDFLVGGTFQAASSFSVIDLGGTLFDNTMGIVAIGASEPTVVILDDNGTLNTWNGSAYVSLQSTLNTLNTNGTLEVLQGGNYVSSQSLVDQGGLLNLQAGTIAVADLAINAGVVQGYATIASSVYNGSTLIALGGTLVIDGTLNGSGLVRFDSDVITGITATTGATLQVGAVAAGQTIVMNGDDTLVLTAPGTFAGTIAAMVGDQIVLLGDTVTSATDTNGTLVIADGGVTLASLNLSGNYTGDFFIATGSTVAVSNSPVPPTITGTMAGQAITSAQTITPFSGVTIGDANLNQAETLTVTLSEAANGILSNLGSGSYTALTGVYTDTGSAAAITADLRGLVFTPTESGTTGSTVTTGFTIADTDTADQTASNTTASVVVTIASTSTITVNGNTALLQSNNGYDIKPSSTSSAVSLQYQGSTVMQGQFPNSAPIGVVQTSTGYEVAFKDTANEYIIWNTNSSGVFTGLATPLMSATSLTLEEAETTFNQDLNGDGTIGPVTTMVSASTTTALTQIANEFELAPVGVGSFGGVTAPVLQYNGAPVTVGEFGTAMPIAAVQTATGYQVVFRDANSNYIIWNTDSSGKFTSLASSLLTGTSLALEQAEITFGISLNGGDVIGPTSSTVSTSLTTALTQVANQFALNPATGGSGPYLQINGAPVTSGQYGASTPIAAVQTATGYQVVFANTTTHQYIVWNTDSSGKFVSLASSLLTGTSTLVSTSTTTALDQVAGAYELNSTTNGAGPFLQYNGALVTTGEWGSSAPIAAVQTSTGYQVAFANTATDQYIVWNTDSSGHFTGLATALVSGQDFSIEDLEPTFGVSLNGGSITPLQLITATNPNGTLDLTGALQSSVINLGSNTAYASSGLTAPSLTFVGTPDAISLGSEPAIVEYALKASSGIETVSGFSTQDELNIDLAGAASSTLRAYDTSVGAAHAIAIYSSADPSHGVVLLNQPNYVTASVLLNQVTFAGGHALISYAAPV